MTYVPLAIEGGLLAVHAHPDDETLSTGGLLATWAAAGLPVTLVTCTRGEQGEVIGPDPDRLEGSGDRFGAHRERELAGALRELDVSDHYFLDQIDGALGANEPSPRYRDSGMSWVGEGAAGTSAAAALPSEVPEGAFYFADLDRAAQSLARLISARRPRYVVTYEPGGGYGHPDHIRAYQLASRAVELISDDLGYVPQLLSSVIPSGVMRFGREVLGQREQFLRDLARDDVAGRGGNGGVEVVIPRPSDPLAAVSSHDPEITYVVEVCDVAGKVLRALEAHATQVQWVADWRDMPASHEKAAGVEVLGAAALSNGVFFPVFSREYVAALN